MGNLADGGADCDAGALWDFVQKGRGAVPYLERGIGNFFSVCDRQPDQPVDALPDRRKLFHASVFYADSGGMPGDGVF